MGLAFDNDVFCSPLGGAPDRREIFDTSAIALTTEDTVLACYVSALHTPSKLATRKADAVQQGLIDFTSYGN